MPDFKVVSEYSPAGDQPQAIEKLAEGLENGLREQVLKGVTGSGKTYTMAKVIEKVNRPTLVLAHNKTLAAQLCAEFREFFPEQCRGVLRLLLRLLPAGGIHPPHGYLYRKGRLHQRGDRPSASVRHLRPAGAAGCHRGLVGELHLRSGRAGRFCPHDDLSAGGHDHGPGRAAAAAGGGSGTSATTWPFSATCSACGATR